MRITKLFLILLLSFATILAQKNDKVLKAKENERAILMEYLETIRDSVQLLTTQYYALKKNNVDQREFDKEEFEKLREQQEKLNGEATRIREEILLREQTIKEELGQFEQMKEEHKNFILTVEELYKKESDGILEAFPLDRENRRYELENLRSKLGISKNPGLSVLDFVNYKINFINLKEPIQLVKQKIYPDDGDARFMTIARFGNVFGYALDTSSTFYAIRQTGKLGSAKYTIEQIASNELKSFLSQEFPQWMNAGKPSGAVLFDVLQNDQSKQLISGKRESSWEAFYHSMEKGGAIMIPMLFLPLWALYIGLRKTFQFLGNKRRYKQQFTLVMDFLSKKDYEQALSFSTKSKGTIARIVQTAVEHRAEGRHIAERWIRDLIMQEVPVLSRGINTIAVIAGAAPLLGLVGTISGMITLFAAVTHHGTGDPKFLAGGISEALITAKTGLTIAIPALFLHDFLKSFKEKIMAELERDALMLMNHIWPGE